VGLTGVITLTQLNTALTALASKTITASTIDSSAIGATTASTGAFTTLSATSTVTLPGGSITNTMLAGSIAAAKLVGTDITVVGTLTGGATGAGFTVNLGTSTISGTLPASAHPALTGDITSTAGALATTLATVNSNTGSFGSGSSIPTFTVNGKGLITAAGSASIAAPLSGISGLGSGVATALAVAAGGVGSVLTTGANANITAGWTVTAVSLTTGSVTPAPLSGNYQYITNNGAFTVTAATGADHAIDLLVTNGASAGAITFSGFTVGASPGTALTTTSGNKFIVSIRRINGVSTYSIYGLQ